jgi:hypothetical protein
VRHGEPTYDEMMMGFVEYVAEKPKQLARIDPKVFDAFAGKYDVGRNLAFVVSREGYRYFIKSPGGYKAEMFPLTETRFSIPDFEEQLTFVKDEKGEIIELLVEQNGSVGHRRRVKESSTGSGQQ